MTSRPGAPRRYALCVSPDQPATAGRRPDGRQRRWDQHKAERRRLVLDAALQVIEETGPRGDVHVQQIAERAGLSRTVLYRHFVDRADLDRAIQTEILDRLGRELLPVLSLDGTPLQVVRRIVAAYVGWAATHPALHRFAALEVPGEGPNPLARTVGHIAQEIESLITLGAQLLEVPMDEDLRSGLDPLVFGIVGSAMAAVRRWLGRPERVPDQDVFIELVAQSIWFQLAGMAAARGVVIDPDAPLQDVFTGPLAARRP